MELPNHVKRVLAALEAAGHEAWCVGGCVRDVLSGRKPEDWDIAASALPEETLAVFGSQALPTGLKHGTVTVKTEGGPVEVTTYRIDGAYQDHRRPESVTFTRSIDQDLARRDFTVNAMAWNPRGGLRDPWGGRADLEKKALRCVGDPDQRFQEDALRILRGLRFAAALGFSLEPGTAEALQGNREGLRDIAAERIQAEFFKLLPGKRAAEVLRGYPEVFGVFWPELLPMVGFGQRNRHHCYDVWEHTLHALAAVPGDPVLRCTVLLHDVGKPASFTLDEAGVGHFYGHPAVSRALADKMLRRLKCASGFRETVVRLVEWHDKDIPRTDRAIRRALRALGEEDLRRLILVKRADNLGQAPAYWGRQEELDKAEALLERLLAEDACVSLKRLAVKGEDLLALGLSGPAVGQALEELLGKVMDGALPNEREALLEDLQKTRAAEGKEEGT